MRNNTIKIITLVFVNIFVFFITYFIYIFPIKYQNNYSSKTIGIYPYSKKINILNIPTYFLEGLNNIDIIKNKYILFQKDIYFQIDRNDLHKRGNGQISFWGQYNSYDDLKMFLKQLNVAENKVDSLLFEKHVVIYQTESTTCLLFLESQNKIRITFGTDLPYSVSSKNQKSDIFQEYYLEENIKNYLYIKNTLKDRYIKIFVSLIIFNILLGILIYILKKINFQVKYKYR